MTHFILITWRVPHCDGSPATQAIGVSRSCRVARSSGKQPLSRNSLLLI